MLQCINGSQKKALRFAIVVAAGLFPFLQDTAQAQHSRPVPHLTFKAADPNEKGDGTLGPEAREALTHGPLPASQADADAKAAADKASDEAVKALKKAPARNAPQGQREGSDDTAALGKPLALGVRPSAPVVVGGINIQGEVAQGTLIPSDSTGAIGPVRFIQLVNQTASLYESTTGVLKTSVGLSTLAQAPWGGQF
jgi:hypothetical protein